MLNITLDINGHVLHSYHVQRVKPVKMKVSPDDLCDYVVTRSFVTGHSFGVELGKVTRHRYGDGADKLMAKVLRKFGRQVM